MHTFTFGGHLRPQLNRQPLKPAFCASLATSSTKSTSTSTSTTNAAPPTQPPAENPDGPPAGLNPPPHDQVFPSLPQPHLKSDYLSYKDYQRVRGHECGPDQRAHLVQLVNLMQEAGSNHVVSLWGRSETGFASDPIMDELNLAFVMIRLQLRLEKYPRWGDVVQVETAGGAQGRLRAWRDWILHDANTGEQLGVATSSWVLLNKETRKLAKIPDVLVDKYQHMGRQRLSKIPKAETGRAIGALGDTEVTECAQFVAPHGDMDMNGHINHVQYVSWLLESVPVEVESTHKVMELEIDFKGECLAGDVVQVAARNLQEDERSGAEKEGYIHVLSKQENGDMQEIVRARTRWTDASELI